MTSIEDSYIIKPFFKYTKKAHIKLNKIQMATRDKVQQKIDIGDYKLQEFPCLCGEKDDVVISETDRYGLHLKTVICKNCGLLRTNPRLDSKSLDGFYKEEYRDLYMGPEYGEMKDYFLNMVERGKTVCSLIKRCLPQINFKELNVLEIGCSVGGILIPFLEAGATVKGYDYDQRYLDYGNRYNPDLNLCFGGLEDLKPENKKYDLVIINHVLEHLIDPQYAIRLIKSKLESDGVFYISVPGLKNPEYYYSPTKSFLGSLHIGHIYYFTKSSLRYLMNDFDVLYMDDEIRAVSQYKNKKSDFPLNMENEFSANLKFILAYEKSLNWKIKRLGIVLKNYPYLIKLSFAKVFSKLC